MFLKSCIVLQSLNQFLGISLTINKEESLARDGSCVPASVDLLLTHCMFFEDFRRTRSGTDYCNWRDEHDCGGGVTFSIAKSDQLGMWQVMGKTGTEDGSPWVPYGVCDRSFNPCEYNPAEGESPDPDRKWARLNLAHPVDPKRSHKAFVLPSQAPTNPNFEGQISSTRHGESLANAIEGKCLKSAPTDPLMDWHLDNTYFFTQPEGSNWCITTFQDPDYSKYEIKVCCQPEFVPAHKATAQSLPGHSYEIKLLDGSTIQYDGEWYAESVKDPYLTEKGLHEAAEQAQHLEVSESHALLIMSPLRRVLTTGSLAWRGAMDLDDLDSLDGGVFCGAKMAVTVDSDFQEILYDHYAPADGMKYQTGVPPDPVWGHLDASIEDIILELLSYLGTTEFANDARDDEITWLQARSSDSSVARNDLVLARALGILWCLDQDVLSNTNLISQLRWKEGYYPPEGTNPGWWPMARDTMLRQQQFVQNKMVQVMHQEEYVSGWDAWPTNFRVILVNHGAVMKRFSSMNMEYQFYIGNKVACETTDELNIEVPLCYWAVPANVDTWFLKYPCLLVDRSSRVTAASATGRELSDLRWNDWHQHQAVDSCAELPAPYRGDGGGAGVVVQDFIPPTLFASADMEHQYQDVALAEFS